MSKFITDTCLELFEKLRHLLVGETRAQQMLLHMSNPLLKLYLKCKTVVIKIYQMVGFLLGSQRNVSIGMLILAMPSLQTSLIHPECQWVDNVKGIDRIMIETCRPSWKIFRSRKLSRTTLRRRYLFRMWCFAASEIDWHCYSVSKTSVR